MVLSIWASLVSADVFWVTFFPPLKSTRDITHQAISDLSSSQENATELLSEDGQSRWITTVYDYESDDEGEQLIYSPPPAALSSDKPMDLKQGDKESILKPFPLVTAKPKQERRQQHTTTSAPAVNSMSSTNEPS